MLLTQSARRAVSGACFALGSLWAGAGVLKLLFGVRITLPIFPPLDLDRVLVVPAIGIGLGLAILGAWLGRTQPYNRSREAAGVGASDQPLFAPGSVPESSPSAKRTATPLSTRSPSA